MLKIGGVNILTMLPDEEKYKKINEWLISYKTESKKQHKSKFKALIVAEMTPVVKKLARTIARRANDPIDDLIQAGFVGLLKSIEDYQPLKNDNFRIYAGYRIIGEMKHFLRDKLNMIRVPRHIHELSIRINSFISTLTDEELKHLTTNDVADALNVPKDNVDMALQVERRRSTLSFDDISINIDSSNRFKYEDVIPSSDYRESDYYNDVKIFIKKLINDLPEKEKELIKLYYYDDMPQKEIAKKMQMSQMAVSRRMKKIFAYFYKSLCDNPDFVKEDE
ncbi:MAG: sigma-70 family RNA polymerase sigma factor [bacterium]|nr:sigma-70 family RNA polymerase sigma factor [bacterium]